MKPLLLATLLSCSLAQIPPQAGGLPGAVGGEQLPRIQVAQTLPQTGGLAPRKAAPAHARSAVVRIESPDQTGVSYGSGVLVAARGRCGLVLTNWHVIREAAGPVQVVFPDGFRSAATVLVADRDWDLAALAIWRPRTDPVALAAEVPQPGEMLTIAGYGRGWYRESSGRCVQYLSPGMDLPFDLVELAAPARQGDSGGPIFNQRGELAGVLFGSAFGRTAGSHCGRVRWFLDRVWPEFCALADQRPTIAQSLNRSAQRPVASIQGVRSPSQPSRLASGGPAAEIGWPAGSMLGTAENEAPSDRLPGAEQHDEAANWQLGRSSPRGESLGVAPAGVSGGQEDQAPGKALSGDGQRGPLPAHWEQIETLLAMLGGGVLLCHGLRLLGRAVG